MKTATELKKTLEALQAKNTGLMLEIDQAEQELQAVNSQELIQFIVAHASINIAFGTFNITWDDPDYQKFLEIVRNIGPFNSNHWDTPLASSIAFNYSDGASQIYYCYNDPEQRDSKDENFAVNKIFEFLRSINFPKDKINFDNVNSEIAGALKLYERRKAEKIRLESALDKAYKD